MSDNSRRARDLDWSKYSSPRVPLEGVIYLEGAAKASAIARMRRAFARLAASVGRNPEGQDAEERLDAEHEHAVPEGQTPKRSRQSNKPGREM